MPHRRRPLRATYRLQIHREFTLADARGIVPYLHRLGVSHVYTSPLFTARAGSTHGYDVVDPTLINPELGGEPAFRGFVHELHAHDMGLLLDIVPNHMGTGSENPFWEDVLAHGRHSRYAHWFDIDWMSGSTDGRPRVVLPVLGDELEAVIRRGEISVAHAQRGDLRLTYAATSFPLSPRTLEFLTEEIPGDTEEAQARIREVHDRQHYRLTSWRRAPDEINYRRFFDVTDLVAVCVDDPAVFAETHARLLDLVADGSVDGLRIDHIDGLRLPRAYLERLRAAVAERREGEFPIFVEKILATGERLPVGWPVEGTTGYEALNDIEDLFIEPAGFGGIELAYRRMLRSRGKAPTFEQVALDAKLRVLNGALRADVARLVRLLEPIAAGHEALVMHGPGMDGGELHADREVLTTGIVELIACLSVYRTYLDGEGGPIPAEADEVLERALGKARRRGVARPEVLDLLNDVLRSPGPLADLVEREARRRFILSFQQTTGPAAAKGVEDTALYTYMPLVSRNEVGGAPDRPLDDAVSRFHESNQIRAARWPAALVSSDTHDAKRSADVRSRLDVLAEMPEVWWERVRRWRTLNAAHRIMLGRRAAPDPNTEYLFYQVLLGIWPVRLEEGAIPDPETLQEIHDRIARYVLKAGKEGKSRTSWVDPVAEFEEATKHFVHGAIFRSPAFLADFAQFASRVVAPGLWTSLSRIALHYTVPGTPDTYQGDELWNLALVDPDNRRPVDYETRSRMLDSVAGLPVRVSSIDRPEDGGIKLQLIHALLRTRRDHPTLFTAGDYLPLPADGTHASHVIAFARSHADEAVLVVAPRYSASLVGGRGAPVGRDVWTDTAVPLPDPLSRRRWHSALDGTQLGHSKSFSVAELCTELPVAVFLSAPD